MNPFVHYRHRLASYQLARDSGWSDERFLALVQSLDDAVGRADGHGFITTPLSQSAALGGALGLAGGELWLKDDTGNVGGSHKARHLFGVLLQQAVSGQMDGELAIASCGNAALAAAVVARAAGRPLTVFIPSWADAAVVARLRLLQAKIVVCERRPGESGNPTYLRFVEAVGAGAVPFSCQASMTPATLDGGRTLGWELADQLAHMGVGGRVRLYVQVGGGALACAAWAGMKEGIELGRTDVEPVMHAVQTSACAPLDRAWQLLERESTDADARMVLARARPQCFMWSWEQVGSSAASGILDDVTYDWLGIAEAMLCSGGWPVTVSEPEVVQAHELVHRHTALDADATGTAGLAGVLHDCRKGRISGSDQVVALLTGVTRKPLT